MIAQHTETDGARVRAVGFVLIGLVSISSLMAAPQSLKATLEAGRLDITIGDELFTSYRFGDKLKKPYLWPVIGPRSGKSVTVESVAKQFPHHNSIWLGCDRVNGQNFWQPHGQIGNGQIRSTGPKLVEDSGQAVVLTDACVWQKPGAEPVMRDSRRIAISAPSEDLRLIDVDVTMTMLTDVTIQRTNHSLFSVRMMPELSAAAGGTLINADGATGEKGTFGKATPWCGFSGTRNGVTEGVALLQHPDNPWYPSRWFTRDYGFMSPTPMFWPPDGKAFRFSKDEQLRLRYRVVVHGGDSKSANIAQIFADYASGAARPADFRPPTVVLSPAVIKEVVSHGIADSRAPLYRLESLVRKAPASDYPAMEKALLGALGSPDLTLDGYRELCRLLARIGSDAAVPALSQRLGDDEFFEPARYTLEQIGTAKALAALRAAVPAAKGLQKVALLNSLGSHRDAAAVPLLKAGCREADAAVVEAAIAALGRIGTKEALAGLTSVVAQGARKVAVDRALLACADRLAAGRNFASALAVYRRLLAPEHPSTLRAAALIACGNCRGEDTWRLLLPALSDPDPVIRLAAARGLGKAGDAATVAALQPRMAGLAPELQAALLAGMKEQKNRATLALAVEAASSTESAVRQEAYGLLGAVGEGEHVASLAAAAANDKDAGGAATRALLAISGPGVDKALLALMDKGVGPVRVQLIRAAAERQTDGALDVVVRMLTDADATVRSEAAKALAKLAQPSHFNDLVRLVCTSESARPRDQLARAITAVAGRSDAAEQAVKAVAAGLPGAQAEARAALLGVLGTIEGTDAARVVTGDLQHSDVEVRRAAIRAVSAWSTPSPLPALLECVRREGDPVSRVLGARGVIRLATLPSERAAAATVAMLSQAIQLSPRPEEKRAALAALPQCRGPEALKFARVLAQDPAVAAEAKLAIARLEQVGPLRFDFQKAGSPVEKGFTEVNCGTLHSAKTGYGWATACHDERDRGRGTALTRDFVFDAKPRVFRVNVPNGTYAVKVYLGDMSGGHDKMTVSAEGVVKVNAVTTKGSEVKECTFEAVVADGVLDLEFKDSGGGNEHWTCPGLAIE